MACQGHEECVPVEGREGNHRHACISGWLLTSLFACLYVLFEGLQASIPGESCLKTPAETMQACWVVYWQWGSLVLFNYSLRDLKFRLTVLKTKCVHSMVKQVSR